MKNNSIKIQCPAKINLTLKVLNKREDGFHNIESIMQTISLFDYLTISISNSDKNEVILRGNSDEIPYDEKNLVYRAAKLYLEECKLSGYKIDVYIEKNIPVAAGLAGGSTDAAGMIYGLNKLLDNICTEKELHNICAKLGSDLNFCLMGGCVKTSGRGEILEPLVYKPFDVNLIKPLNLGISAKEAYTKFSQKLALDSYGRDGYKNDLEWAVIDDYEQLQYIQTKYPNSMMTGSGSTYFSLIENFDNENGYWVKNGLKTVDCGVKSI